MELLILFAIHYVSDKLMKGSFFLSSSFFWSYFFFLIASLSSFLLSFFRALGSASAPFSALFFLFCFAAFFVCSSSTVLAASPACIAWPRIVVRDAIPSSVPVSYTQLTLP